MGQQKKTPGAAGTATEGENGSAVLLSPHYRLRQEWATAAWFALDHCDPADQVHICATYLAENETGGPLIPVLGLVSAADVALGGYCPAA